MLASSKRGKASQEHEMWCCGCSGLLTALFEVITLGLPAFSEVIALGLTAQFEITPLVLTACVAGALLETTAMTVCTLNAIAKILLLLLARMLC